MSVQFGKCNFDGKPVDPTDLDEVRPVLAPYGPDAEGYICKDNFASLYRAFHTTKESGRELKPHVMESGSILMWDGRLDNRKELNKELANKLSANSADSEIAAGAYRHWGTGCFAKLIGDWAISIWDPCDQTVILACDPVGIGRLYYSFSGQYATWSTIIDPLVLFANRTFALNEEYIAGILSFFPAAHATPYVGIDSVPPACFVTLRHKLRTITKYWDFDPNKRIQYREDREYEEHFRETLTTAVGRRLRSHYPVLAELSGGLDSSSVVCIADAIIAHGAAETPRLDTLSYYNDSEPSWNERPYFTKVEEKRGRAGCHIDVGGQTWFDFQSESIFAATPVSSIRLSTAADERLAELLRDQGNRVVLTGTGGDEVTGGVPTPIPELMDLLATGRVKDLAHQLRVWALNQRKPWFHLLIDAARGFLPPSLVGIPAHMKPAPWLHTAFVRGNWIALTGYMSRVKLFGSLPAFQENMFALDMLRRQLPCSPLAARPPREKRYPYLDRDLLEFMYAIPREQVVRPGQRRSLMRRALNGIVPDELINRKRKAFVVRSLWLALSAKYEELVQMSRNMILGSLGIIDPYVFSKMLESVRYNRELPTLQMIRTIGVELWLRSPATLRVLTPIT
jgi:asparagine synthase (glutamine-hydrolysing)